MVNPEADNNILFNAHYHQTDKQFCQCLRLAILSALRSIEDRSITVTGYLQLAF